MAGLAVPSSQTLFKRSFCVITGASRGIGRAIAVSLSEKFADGSVLVLTGRREADLQETRRLIYETAYDVGVKTVTADLANQATFPDFLTAISKDVDPADFKHALLINNAGEFWDPSRYTRQLTTSDLESLQRLLDAYSHVRIASLIPLLAGVSQEGWSSKKSREHFVRECAFTSAMHVSLYSPCPSHIESGGTYARFPSPEPPPPSREKY